MNIQSIYPSDPLWEAAAEFTENCLWPAGKTLAKRMRECDFHDWECVFLALDGDKIAGFCTLSETDILPRAKAPYCPFVGSLFIDLPYRGNRLGGQLIEAAAERAKEAGFDRIFLISDEVGLFEKYGFQGVDRRPSPVNKLKNVTIFTRPVEPNPAADRKTAQKSMLQLIFYLLLMIGAWVLIGKLAFPT